MACLTLLEEPEEEKKKKGFRPDLNLELQERRYEFDKERARLKYLDDISGEME